MKTRIQRGFTLIELIIVISIIGIVAAILIGLVFHGCSSSRGTAEDEAKAYAASMGIQIYGVSCMNRDTDGDGYVSCSLSVKDKNGNPTVTPIECASRWQIANDGCKVPVLQAGALRGLR
jgi:prepilin-type N-terminal cleavage/methylation domain-containing protein